MADQRRDTAISLQVKPRSPRAGLALVEGRRLVARVHAPASEGAANQECIRLLADALGVAKSRVQIVRGAKSRQKQVLISGMSAEEARARLWRAASQEPASP